MSGPWEDYAQPEQGPWTAFQQQAAPPPPEETPEAFKDRLRAGSYLTGDIGAAMPEAHADFSKTFEGRQLKGLWDMFTLPGRVMKGETKLDTSEGMNETYNMALGITLGRMNEMPGNGAGAVIDQGGGRFARPVVDDAGKPQVAPIGGLPTPEDFSAAGKVLDSPHAETNLKQMWQDDGIHPAEAVHDAQSDGYLEHQITAPHTEFFHGSPSDFIEFDNSKIGSGEGAQSFAYGHYLAESPDVAKGYAEKLGVDAKGNVYTTRLKPGSDQFLQWETDLSEQPAGQAILEKMDPDFKETLEEYLSEHDQPELSDLTGGMLHRLLERYASEGELPGVTDRSGHNKREASEYLESLDVPGVSFLDKKSRRTGAFNDLDATAQGQNPTRNFVVFNGKDIEITHKNGVPVETIPKSWGVKPEEMDEAFGSASLSAALTPPDEIPIDVQPASPPGSLIASAQAAADKLFDIGRDIHMKLAPMSRGSVESMATVKDYMNSMRRNAWDSSRIDTNITEKFSPEQRERMARAMEEESLSLRLGEPESAREHQGLATLEPEERQAILDLDAAQQLAWYKARDLGMVEGDGIPMHFPRMALGAKGDTELAKPPSLTQMYGIRKNSPNLQKREYMEAEDTERALKIKYGDQAKIAWDIRAVNLATKTLEDSVAGRTLVNNIEDVGKRTGLDTVAVGFRPDDTWFTVDHPAFQKWRPKIGEDGAIKDEAGNPVFEQVPIYVRGDFEGPLRAALWGKSGATYQGLMAIKGKTMGLIMNSPAIHNLVEFGRAFPAMPVRIFKAYFDGYRAKQDVGLMHEAIDAGLVPIGKRFFNQDIDSIMESPDLEPGRSWTAKILSAVPGLFDEAAGTAVKRAIDKAGDVWHNKLLWDRVADLQMGLYTNFRGDLINKGMDAQTSSRIAAHFANRYAGSLPKEAMGEMATKVSNFMLFSRSFTMGNLGVMKDMLTGLPKDVLAQIERDAGFRAGSIDEAGLPNSPVDEAIKSAKSVARRKALMTVGLDVALMYAGNAVLQNAFNIMLGSSVSEEEAGYIRRARDLMNDANVHPLSLLNPFTIASRLSPTSDNEPGKSERVLIGYAKDGTAIYARNPVGKIGEEFTGYFDGPLDMLRKKEGTILRPMMQIYSNDAGFGRKIYDPNAETAASKAGVIWAITKHLMASQLPVGQIGAFSDLIHGQGDSKVNALQAFGPFAGVTFSRGAPGGPAVGEMYHNKSAVEFRVQQAMPDIRRQIQRGDVAGAQQVMQGLGMDGSYQRWVIKTTQNPTRLSAKGLSDFYRTASPEQRDRMMRLQQAPQP